VILSTIVDQAGDLIIGTAADTVARFAHGDPGQVLMSTGTGSGLAWSNGDLIASNVLATNANILNLTWQPANLAVEIVFFLFGASGTPISLYFGGLRGSARDGAAQYNTLSSAAWPASQFNAVMLSNQTQWSLYGANDGVVVSGRLTLFNVNAANSVSGIGDYLVQQSGTGTRFRYNQSFDLTGTMGSPFTGVQLFTTVNNFGAGSYARMRVF